MVAQLLHLCFTGTLALKLLVRVCTKTCKFYTLLPSDLPHFGLMLSSKQDWISTALAAAPVPSQLLSFPQERSLLTSSDSSERLLRICFLCTMALETTWLNWSLTCRVWIQRMRGFLPFDTAPLMECFKNFVCLRWYKSDSKTENIFIGITWYLYIQNLYHSGLKYFINISLTCKMHILHFGISHSHRGILAISSYCMLIFLFVCLPQCIFHD